MNLIKYVPRRVRLSPFDDMNRLFNHMFSFPLSGELVPRSWTPAFDIRETDNQLIFDSALPGMNKKDIEVTIHDGVLTVTGEFEDREIKEDDQVHSAELRRGKFSRSFALPTEVDEAKVDALYKNGILTITLNKVTPIEEQKRRITVK